MEIMRLVVTGTVGVGKSTLVRSISDIEVVDTDRPVTNPTSSIKEKTTIALDFGRVNFGPRMALHLYGTPGQPRFDFVWELLIRRAHAYILLVPAHRPEDWRRSRQLMILMQRRVQVPMIIGLTHTDHSGAWSEEDVAKVLGFGNFLQSPVIVKINPTQKASVSRALITLVNQFSIPSKASKHGETLLAS